MQAELAAFKADLGGNEEVITLSTVCKYDSRGGILRYCNLCQTSDGAYWYPVVVSQLGEHRVVNDSGVAQAFFSQQEIEQYMRKGGCLTLPFEVAERGSAQLLAVRL